MRKHSVLIVNNYDSANISSIQKGKLCVVTQPLSPKISSKRFDYINKTANQEKQARLVKTNIIV